MADSLLDIGVNQSSGAPAPTKSLSDIQGPVTPPTAPVPQGPLPVPQSARGDDLMARARSFNELSPADSAAAKLFYQSKDLLSAKMQNDPAYADRMLGELGKLKGREYTDKMVNEADALRIDYLKKSEPHLFNSDEAAKAGFFNTATFGQLSRITGYVGQLVQGRPATEVIQEQAEKLRLLQKAYPTADLLGSAASYLVPGSPAKALFEKAAGIGAHTVGSLLERVVANPNLLTKVGQVVAGGAGGAANGAVTGTLGSGDDTVSFDRGAETSLGQGASGALTAGLFAGASGAVGSAVKKGAGLVATTVEQATGVPAEALRAYNADPMAIKNAAGRQMEIGHELTDYLLTAKRSNLPEVVEANKLLNQLPDVPANRVINYLRNFGKTLNPSKDSDVGLLHEWADRIEASMPTKAVQSTETSTSSSLLDPSGKPLMVSKTTTKQVPITQLDPNAKIPAWRMREIVDEMQDASQDYYGKDSKFLGSALKVAARTARLSIADTAAEAAVTGAHPQATEAQQELGKIAGTYTDLMQKASEKRGILKFVTTQLGRNPESMEKRAEGFISNLFGANKSLVQARMAALDEKFGTDFSAQAQNASYAKQISATGVPNLLPNHPTGAALKGTIIGSAIGGAAGFLGGRDTQSTAEGAAIGAVVSSPRVGAALIGASDKITGFVNQFTTNPGVLNRMMKDSDTPKVVKELVGHVQDSLAKDGPISAGSTMRIIADTPFFLGLVHSFDINQQRMESNQRYQAVKKVENGK